MAATAQGFGSIDINARGNTNCADDNDTGSGGATSFGAPHSSGASVAATSVWGDFGLTRMYKLIQGHMMTLVMLGPLAAQTVEVGA